MAPQTLIVYNLYLIFFSLPFVLAGNSTDPVKNFCRRAGLSVIIKNETFLLNGGFQTFADYGRNGAIDPTTLTLGNNQALLSVNLNSSWPAQAIPMVPKVKWPSGNIAGYKTPPNLAYGALFAGPPESTRIYSFGGTSSGYNSTFQNYFLPPDTMYALWFYDFETTVWTAIDTHSQGITIPSHGASAEAVDQGLAFYLGGQIDNGTSNDTSSLKVPLATPGMIVINTSTGRVNNFTILDSATSNRQDGAAIYISTYGEKGVIIAMGGISNSQSLNMSQIAVFDVATLNYTARSTNSATANTWYTVQASGEIPNPRSKFCIIAVNSQDYSSTNIYVYGGQSDSSVLDDVFVLSLPSFTWTRVFSGTSARWGMSCAFVAPRNMVIAGGAGPTNNLTADCDWLNQGIGFLDLSEVRGGSGWTSNFDADAKPYEVPFDVLNTIGGSGQGGAVLTSPSAGWDSTALQNLFQPRIIKSANGTNSTTPSSPPNLWTDLTTAAQAGIVVGSILAVLSTGIAVFFVHRRRQKRRPGADSKALKDSATSELQAPGEPQEVHASGKKSIQAEKDSTAVYEAPVLGSEYEVIHEVPENGVAANDALYEAPVPQFYGVATEVQALGDEGRSLSLSNTRLQALLQAHELQ